VFEDVEGGTLDRLVGKRGALPVDEALEVASRSREARLRPSSRACSP
jgi:hypothetical protein